MAYARASRGMFSRHPEHGASAVPEGGFALRLRAAWKPARPAQCRSARSSLHWCRRGSSRLHPVIPGSAELKLSPRPEGSWKPQWSAERRGVPSTCFPGRVRRRASQARPTGASFGALLPSLKGSLRSFVGTTRAQARCENEKVCLSPRSARGQAAQALPFAALPAKKS
jgi:hypothetical protein